MSRTLRKLGEMQQQLIANCDRLIGMAEDEALLALHAPRISEWNIGLHVEHLGKVGDFGATMIDEFLDQGGGPNRGFPNIIGWLVLLSNNIPRGKAQVPEIMAPEGVEVEAVRGQLREVRQWLVDLAPRLEEVSRLKGTQTHLALGDLTAFQWVKFSVIHDRHHLTIIEEIRQAARAG